MDEIKYKIHMKIGEIKQLSGIYKYQHYNSSITYYICKILVDGQARLLMFPQRMTDSNQCMITKSVRHNNLIRNCYKSISDKHTTDKQIIRLFKKAIALDIDNIDNQLNWIYLNINN